MLKKSGNVDEIESKLSLQLEMINQTEAWWVILYSKKCARYQFLKEKLQQSLDHSVLPEMNVLEQEIRHLQNKMNWEKQEIVSFENRQSEFDKLKQQKVIDDLSSKIIKKLSSANNKKKNKRKK